METTDCRTEGKRAGLLLRIYRFYYDGFTHMTVGRTLWTVILIKLAIMFLVLKLFFFPDFLNKNAPDGDKAGYVTEQMTKRSGR